MVNSTLQQIRDTFRTMARVPSTGQMTDVQVDQFINSFLTQDFPQHLRVFNLHTVFEFYTTPLVADYSTTTSVTTSPFYQFKNRYTSVSGPIYFAGIEGQLVQDRTSFFTYYPQNTFIQNITDGDGIVTAFSGTTSSHPILQYQVLFNSVDINGNAITLIDAPQTDLGFPDVGNLIVPNNPATSYGTINYATGNFSLTFPIAPAAGAPVNVQYFAYQPSRPIIALYYNGVFSLRPVPDQAYKVSMNAYVQPIELLTTDQAPELNQWWEFIAVGAAIKYFERRVDMESIANLQPIFDKYEALAQRSTLVLNAERRVSTIYQYANSPGAINGWNGFGQY